MKYAISIISLIAISSTIYAFNIETDPQVLIERENRQKVLDCMENVHSSTGTARVLQEQIEKCAKIGLQSIIDAKATTGSVIPVPERSDSATLGDNNSGKILGEMRCPELYMSGSEVFSPRYGVTWEFTIKEAKELYPKCKILDNAKATIATNTKDLRLSICKNIPNSPLCNEENYTMARAIAYKKALIWGIADREYFFRVGIGIMNSESTLGTKYAGTCNQSYNNFGGIKYRILDTGKAVHDQTIPQNGCWMYKFATMEDYFGSKYNSLGKGYGKCFAKKDAVQCIAFAYVGDPKVAEQSWQNNVNTYAK